MSYSQGKTNVLWMSIRMFGERQTERQTDKQRDDS